MKTLLTVCSTLACAGGAFVAYEHPEWVRQGAQQWEAWRRSSAESPSATPVARAIEDATEHVSHAATDLHDRAAGVASQPVAGKPLDQWFTELSGLSGSSTAGTGQSSRVRDADDLQSAARVLAGAPAESAVPAVDASHDEPVIERGAARFQTSQKSIGEDGVVAQPVSMSRPTHAVSLASKILGQGPLRTLVVAGLNGEDCSAIEAVRGLTVQLGGLDAVLREQTLLLVPAANPGGVQAGHRFNAQNVDLNRNFPGRRYRPQVEFSGAFPASESETQQLLRLMFEFQPERLIHVVDDALATRVLYNRAASELAGELQRQHQVAIERLDFDRLPGSLEEFADGVFHVPVLVICLKPGESAGLLTALATTVEKTPRPDTDTPSESRPANPEPAPAGPVAGPRSPVPAAPASGRGYEELPPPPQ